MSFAPPKATKPPTIRTISVKAWEAGTVTGRDDGRTPKDGLRSSGNVMLDQDGVIRPRPSLTTYGPQPVGTVLGEIFEFRDREDMSFTNWLISLQNVNGVTKVYIAQGEDTTWTEVDGKEYDDEARGHFFQIGDKVVITNGEDDLSYLDIATSTVIPFDPIDDPTAPTLDTLSNLTGTTFNIFYAITANSTIGETAASPTLEQPVSTARDFWTPPNGTNPQSVKITWSPVADARSYNVYAGQASNGADAPTLYRIATNLPADTLSFTDDGSRAYQLVNVAPDYNSTAGPKATRGASINGRAWLIGDKNNPYYVWNGGDPGFELDFSPANGGNFTRIGNGTKELPTIVTPFHQGKGDPGIFVLSQGTNGYGKRYILAPNSITYGDDTITFYDVTEDNGQDGTDSPDGVITYNDALWYPSRDGFKTTGTKPQLQNVLSTDRVSDTIQPDIKTLNSAAMANCVGRSFEGRLYWALPVSSSRNNQIWVLDLDRKGAWMKPWNIAADWMWLYSDNSGTTHFLILSNNQILELSYKALTADNGVSFPTSGVSGQIPFSEDGQQWGRLIRVIFKLLRPQGGPINFTVSGKTEDENLAVVGRETFTADSNSTRAGWSEPQAGWSSLRGWSEIKAVPSSFNEASQDIPVEVDEDLKWFSYGWNTNSAGVDYALADVIAVYVNVGYKDI